MATVTGDFSIDFSGVADANPYSNPDFIPLQSSQARVVSGVLRSVDGSTPGIFMLDPEKYVPGSVITAKIEVSDVGSGFDALTCGVVDEDGNGYRIFVHSWGVGRWRIDEWTQHNDSGEGDFFTPNNGDTFEVEYNKGTGSLVVRRNGSPLTLLALTDSAHADKNLAPYFGAEPSDNGAGGILSFAADGVEGGEDPGEEIVATKLVFTAQPGNTVVGQTMSAVQVAAVDDDDQLDTSFDGNVTIALQTGDGTLLGTLTKAAVGGLATFDDLSNRTLNEGAVLRATADGLTSADSDEFDITAGGGGGATGLPSSSRLGGLLQ